MQKNLKKPLILIAFGVALYAALMNLGTVMTWFTKLYGLISPVAFGFVFAFVLNVPMRALERLLSKLYKKKEPNKKLVRLTSLVLTLLAVLLVIALVFTMLIPELISSVVSLYELVTEKLPEWTKLLASYDIDTKGLTAWFNSLDLKNLVSRVTSSAGTVLTSAFNIASSAVSGVASFFISVVIAIYALLSKDELCAHATKLLSAYARPTVTRRITRACKMINETYQKFLSGQCVEAVILGVLIFIAFSIFRIPYASLTAVLSAVLAFVPYIGSFAACVIGAFLVLLVNPSQVILCVIVYFVVQFIENQFIYPYVVGNSVGLSALWTIIAVFVGGKLMGVIGMIFFIPLTAVFVNLLRERTNRVLNDKTKEKPSEQ